MYQEIKEYELSGKIMKLEEQIAIEELFQCLCKFCLGSSENGREIIFPANSELVQSLRLLIQRMLKWGWGQTKINSMISYATYDYNCNGKHFGQVSLNQLMGAGVDFVDEGDSSLSDVQQEQFTEEKKKIEESMTAIQKEYYELYFIRNLPEVSIAKIMGKNKSTVSRMIKTLKTMLQPLEEFNKNTGGGIVATGYRINHNPARESDKVNPYGINPSLPFSKIFIDKGGE